MSVCCPSKSTYASVAPPTPSSSTCVPSAAASAAVRVVEVVIHPST